MPHVLRELLTLHVLLVLCIVRVLPAGASGPGSTVQSRPPGTKPRQLGELPGMYCSLYCQQTWCTAAAGSTGLPYWRAGSVLSGQLGRCQPRPCLYTQALLYDICRLSRAALADIQKTTHCAAHRVWIIQVLAQSMACPSVSVAQEGKPRHECYTPEVLAAIQADGWNFAAPGGESQRQLEERVVSSCCSAVLTYVPMYTS